MIKYRVYIDTDSYQDYATVEEIEEGVEYVEIEFNALTNDPITDEYEKYLIRKEDGIRAYLLVASELRIAKLNSEIDESTHRHIEYMLEPVRDEVVLGQWIGALEKLQMLDANEIGIDLYNTLYFRIDTYIQNNY